MQNFFHTLQIVSTSYFVGKKNLSSAADKQQQAFAFSVSVK
jgi:hypothetical protein